MEKKTINSDKKNIKLNYYKIITDKGELLNEYDYYYQYLETFDVYNLNIKENNEKNENFLGGYLAAPNRETKNIEIYKICSKDNIKLIYTLEVGFDSIQNIKYFYDKYRDINYLTALINKNEIIKIWKIKDETNYELILNYTKSANQGGYSMSYRPIRYKCYSLLFNENNSILAMIYHVQNGCTQRDSYIKKYDFINKRELGKFKSNSLYGINDFNKIFPIIHNGINYLGILSEYSFFLYDIFSPIICRKNRKKCYYKNDGENSETESDEDNKNYFYYRDNDEIEDDEEIKKEKEKMGKKKIKINIYPNSEIINGILIHDIKNEINHLYSYQTEKKIIGDYEVNENNICKIDINNNQILFKMNLGSIALISMIVWDDKYLLLFEKEKNYILLFNLLTGRIETKFIYENKDNYLFTGKKLVINDKEELLFVNDSKGFISLWIN